MIETHLTLVNKLGLHARAASKLAAVAGRFECTIRTGRNKDRLVDAKSIMSLMLLAATKGTELYFLFDGDDEANAEQAVAQLIANRFEEAQ